MNADDKAARDLFANLLTRGIVALMLWKAVLYWGMAYTGDGDGYRMFMAGMLAGVLVCVVLRMLVDAWKLCRSDK